MILLPPDLLTSFCAIAEGGSFQRAAERVGRSQAAVSQQIQRLEALVGHPLFRRQGRRMVLTMAGEALLGHARRLLALNAEAVRAVAEAQALPVRLGLVQDFADAPLSGALCQWRRHSAPLPRLAITVGRSAELLADLDRGALDLVVTLHEAGRPHDHLFAPEPMAWLGADDLAALRPLPLALLAPPCRFRDAALAALSQAGISWTMAAESTTLAGLRAAVAAGLGVTCRTSRLLQPLCPGLPPLPSVQFAVTARPDRSDVKELAKFLIFQEI